MLPITQQVNAIMLQPQCKSSNTRKNHQKKKPCTNAGEEARRNHHYFLDTLSFPKQARNRHELVIDNSLRELSNKNLSSISALS